MTPILAAVLAVHGLIHLLGFVKAFGWAELPQLTRPIGPILGLAWLVAALLFVSAALSLYAWPRWSAALAACAVIVSTAVIVPSWADAKVGAGVNAVVLAALALGFFGRGR